MTHVKQSEGRNLASSRTQEVTCFFQTGDLESDHLQRSPLDFRLDFQVLLNGKVTYIFDCGFT